MAAILILGGIALVGMWALLFYCIGHSSGFVDGYAARRAEAGVMTAADADRERARVLSYDFTEKGGA